TQGQRGESVRELQQRLIAAGFLANAHIEPGFFCRATADALINFQTKQGLPADGYCDRNTWAALVEAAWILGSRLLYLTSPHMRGDDVASLQHQLARLGFDCGRVDGILGPRSIHAL
ncbi:MAG: peptidoglycan-binding domain-containing protein, partial [Ilumatobacteraceae bacterium]